MTAARADARDTVLVGDFKRSALAFLGGIVPAAAEVFYTVDSQQDAIEHVVHGVDRPPLAVYDDHFHRLDPFHPRHFQRSMLPLVTLDHVGGLSSYERSDYCLGFMRPLGFLHEVELHLRDAGRIVAGISLLRRRSEPGFTGAELALLRRTHPFLEHCFATCRIATRRSADRAQYAERVLTQRERDVARLVCEGATNEEIGRALYIGLPTVKTHLQHTYRKLGVRSRTELVADLGPQPFG